MMDEKMRATYETWWEKRRNDASTPTDHDIIEWTIDYLRSQPEPLTDEYKAILKECRKQAMRWTVEARIPECGEFGRIAQDLDYVCAELENSNTITDDEGVQAGEVHPDDAAVDAFAATMKEKLAAARAKGRGGWNSNELGMQQRLSDMLRAHVEKGDPRDVANFCMFLHQRGESILPQPAEGEEIMVNAAHDVYTLPLQPSGLSSGPRFVVHVPGAEPQPSLMDGATYRCRKCGEQNEIMLNSARIVTRLQDGSPRDPRDIESDPAGTLIHDPDKPLYAAPVAAQSEQITPKQLARLIADNPDVQFSVKPRPADEELRRDAERYRWLRDQIKLGPLVIAKCGSWDLESWSGDDPDTRIDAAIAAEKKKEE